MPPLRKYSKEEIIHISYEIVRKEGKVIKLIIAICKR